MVSLVLNFVYSAAIVLSTVDVLDHVVTVSYLAGVLAVFLVVTRLIASSLDSDQKKLSRIMMLAGIAGHVGLLLGFAASNAPDSILWVPDSYTTHLPGAKNVAEVLRGHASLRETNGGWDAIRFTHFYVGLFFAVFGVKPWVSSFALMIAKVGTYGLILSLGKRMFDRKTALIGLLTYILMPTIVFYTTTFYKEALVQFFVALSFLGLYLLIAEKRYLGLLLLAASLGLIAIERFYLFPAYVLVLVAAGLTAGSGWRRVAWSAFILVVTGAGAVGFYWFYKDALIPSALWANLKATRDSFNDYSDVSREYNRDLFYPLAVLKILFTPYFTPKKFTLFGDFSFLLLWGSFFNQIVIAGAMWTLFSRFKTYAAKHWFVWIPFLFFILLFAYLAPFSGRQRDTFYPLLSLYFAALVVKTNFLRRS